MEMQTAFTIINETLEETTFKMISNNKKEFMADKEKAGIKYMKLALDLHNKARIYIDENKKDAIRYIEFGLSKTSKES